jgi:hypothetical protein
VQDAAHRSLLLVRELEPPNELGCGHDAGHSSSLRRAEGELDGGLQAVVATQLDCQ